LKIGSLESEKTGSLESEK